VYSGRNRNSKHIDSQRTKLKETIGAEEAVRNRHTGAARLDVQSMAVGVGWIILEYILVSSFRIWRLIVFFGVISINVTVLSRSIFMTL
jgi:hypothetical protein